MSIDGKHNALYPCGKEPDIFICESRGHEWKSITFRKKEPKFQDEMDRLEIMYRYCFRCERNERWQNGKWEINDIEPQTI